MFWWCSPLKSSRLLDEPTSGLDSHLSKEQLRALRRLAETNVTIVAVLHQPSWTLCNMFDDIMFLSKGGRVSYVGPVAGIRSYFETDLGYVFPEGENIVDVALDAISGEIESLKEGVTADSIPELWLNHVVEPISEEDLSINGSEGNIRALQLPEIDGTQSDFFRGLTIGFLMPPALLLTFYHRDERYCNRMTQYGAFLGAVLMVASAAIGGFFAAAVISTRTTLGLFITLALWTFSSVNIFAAFGCFIGWLVCMIKGRQVSLSLASHFFVGVFLGAFLLPVLLTNYLLEKTKYATLLGFGTWLVALGSALGAAALIARFSGNEGPMSGPVGNAAEWLKSAELLLFVFAIFGLILISVSVSRWKRIPSSDRFTSNFPFQTLIQFRRALSQYSRNWFGIALDLGLPLMTGLMVGVLALGKKWTPPLSEVSAWAANATSCLGCAAADDSIPPRIDAMCRVLQLSEDPYPPIGLMASMGIGLVAVASSLRLFSNQSVILRETQSGIYTESMYIGRSCMHLLVSFVASMLFTLSFYWLVQPHSYFWGFFALFLLIHLCCSGLGFYCSILFPPALSALVGILAILSFVLFSGSLFIYGVAAPPIHLWVQFSLWVISNISVVRWSYELFYLLMMDSYIPYLADPSLSYAQILYGFSYAHWTQGWTVMVMLTCIFRILPYVALVAKEKH